ncbi:MAG: RluA family pseudouridine synthase [Alphaproteobacteria bacterium]|nr:RluA family pseudouridine synthase [Alphaproteobacteria bacterium]
MADDDAGLRLDKFLATRLPDHSRARLQALIAAGEVCRDGIQIADGSARVKPGQRFSVTVPDAKPATPKPEAIALDVLYEDEHLLVLEKPAGMVVHPAPGHSEGTLVHALLHHCEGSLSGIGGVQRPGIVHRLDKDVSGLMVVAKHDKAHIGLSAQFTVHRITRAYEAITWGVPAASTGTVDKPIGRHPKDRKRMAVVASGKRAVTHYRLLAAAGMAASRLEVMLETGRTHQIRVHLGTLGLGIIGDPIYRPRRMSPVSQDLKQAIAGLGRITLHARRLGFQHPVLEKELSFDRPPPTVFDRLFEQFQREF